MKQLLIALTLALISTSTWADWTEFSGSSNQGKVKTYFNLATLRNQDQVLKIWQLQDYNTTQTTQQQRYLSVKSLLEVNCSSKMRRTMAASYYKLNMGRGEAVLKNSNPAEWEHIGPDVTVEAMRRFYCGRD